MTQMLLLVAIAGDQILTLFIFRFGRWQYHPVKQIMSTSFVEFSVSEEEAKHASTFTLTQSNIGKMGGSGLREVLERMLSGRCVLFDVRLT